MTRGNADHTTREAVLGILGGVDGEMPLWMLSEHIHAVHRISQEATRECVQRLTREGAVTRTRRGYYAIGVNVAPAELDTKPAPLTATLG